MEKKLVKIKAELEKTRSSDGLMELKTGSLVAMTLLNMDEMLRKAGFTVHCLFRKMTGEVRVCEMYVDMLLIATSDVMKRKAEAQHQAYTRAFVVLANTSILMLLNSLPRLNAHDLRNPNVIVWKGSRYVDSNLETLLKKAKAAGGGRLEAAALADMIFVEPACTMDERVEQAFKILWHSANTNNMYLEFYMEQNDLVWT
jgi:hypothetical protein